MTMLTVVQAACRELSIPAPNAAASSTDLQTTQMVAFYNELGEELMLGFDWQDLVTEYTFATTGASSYALPSNFNRMVDQTQWDRSSRWPLAGPRSEQAWQWLQSGIGTGGPRVRYRIQGGVLKLHPSDTTGTTIAYEYVRNTWCVDDDGSTLKTAADGDSDSAVFPDRLMIAGIKLRFFAIKGFDTTALQKKFDEIREQCIGQDKGAPVLSLARRRVSRFIGPENVPDTGYGS